MSSISPTELDFTRVCEQLATQVSQARDMPELVQQCTDLLDLVAPDTPFALVWGIHEGPQRTLGARGVPLPTLPEQEQLEHLRAGLSIDLGPEGTSWLPLRLGGELQGWLQLAPAGWSNEQAQALALISAVLAPTIATLVSQATNQLRIDQLRTLNDIGQVLSSKLNIEDLTETIYQGVCRVLDAPNFVISLYEEQHEQLRMLLTVQDDQRLTIPPTGLTWPVNSGLSGLVVRLRAPVRTDHYTRECQRRGITPFSTHGPIIDDAWMCVPMLVQDKVLGVIGVSSSRHTYTNEQLDLLQTIAAQASIAIANAQLYQRAERQTRQLDSLNRIGRSITSTLDPERVPPLIMGHIQELLDAEEGSLLLLDDESGELVFAYAGGPAGNQLIGQRLPRGAGIAGHVFSTAQASIVNDVRTDGRFYADTDSHTGFVTSSLLAVPLRGVGGVQGVMEVINKRNDLPFTDDDLRLMEAVADQAVIALENAHRFAQVDQALAQRVRDIHRTNSQLHEILRVGNALRAERYLEGVLRQLVDAVSRSTGFRSAMIALVDRQQTRQPYLRRAAVAGSAARIAPPAQAARASLDAFEALLRPEFQRGPATYLIDHRNSDYFALWGLEEQRSLLAEWPGLSEEWDPRDVLLTVLVDSTGNLLGFLRVHDPETSLLPTPEQVQILEIFANQAAVAIENARLYEELQHGLRSLMALNGLGMSFNNMRRSQEQIFSMTASGVMEITGALEAYVLLNQDEPTADRVALALMPLAHIGRNQQFLPLVRQRAQHVVLTGRPDLLVIEHADTIEAADFVAGGARALVVMPLRAAQHTLGALCVCYREGLPPAADLETLTLFATQAAAAAESLRLWDALSLGRDQLTSVMASTRDGILLIDSDNQIAVANSALHHLCNTNESVGQGNLSTFLRTWAIESNYPDDEWQLLYTSLMQVASGEAEIVHGQLNQLAPRARSLEWTALAAHGAGESLGGQLLVVRDITDAKEAERLRQDLTNMIVHDMRSPLTGIMTAVDMLFKDISGSLTDTQRSMLTIANNSAQQMLGMVNMMLDISRLESGRMPLNCEPAPLDSLVRRATSRLSSLAQDRRISLRNDFPLDLPLVYVDSDLVVRVLQNLLDNALKFSGYGSTVVVRASVVAHPMMQIDDPAQAANVKMLSPEEDGAAFLIQPLHQVMVSVIDQGVGIAPEYQEKIFDKFGQVGDRRGGSGLGLTFCKLVAENHGGIIGVESALYQGSTFFFTLPIITL